jgi:LuxR family maltose regulon positive regulatory protein
LAFRVKPGERMVETISAGVSPALAHIIERPRLIERLEEGGGSRVSVLTAPAGYGKTTLARQWAERQTCPVVWYRANRASGDVALLAVQFDELLASLAPELPREDTKVATIASVNPDPKPLGRALVRTFGQIATDLLIIVDEWEAAETPESDELLSMLVEGINVRWLITTRDRPEWFGPRLEVYGQGVEIGVDELRMTDEEAAHLLSAAGAEAGRTRVMRTAAGWPAVLGLAAMRGEVDFSAEGLLSHTLDEYLVSELIAAATAETQEALMLLAVSAIVDIGRAGQLLGKDEAAAAVTDASARGLLAVTDQTVLYFHPLLRDLLIRRFVELEGAEQEALLERLRHLFDQRLWDEALSVAELSPNASFIADAIGVALDDLLAAGRTSSLERWVAAARTAGAESGLIDYAEAELRLRNGEYDHSIALAACGAEALEGDAAARAHLVAARAASLSMRLRTLEAHLSLAETLTMSPRTEADLRWLRFIACLDDEHMEVEKVGDDLARLDHHTHDYQLRLATAELSLGRLYGSLGDRIEFAESRLALVNRAEDPYASTAMLNGLAYGLNLTGRYSEALAMADRELDIADAFGLGFVEPHAQTNRAFALTALRRFGDAGRALGVIEKRLRDGADPYLAAERTVRRAVLEIGRGDLSRAADHLAAGVHPRAGKRSKAEHCAVNAIILSGLGRIEEAEDRVKQARRLSETLEIRALLAASSLIRAALAGRDAEVSDAYEQIVESEVMYVLPIAWRACFRVASSLLSDSRRHDVVLPLLLNANDTAIARRAGASLPRIAGQPLGLSDREQEVCELLAQGRTNQEIAAMLFISVSTTKVHVKHILEKLGARSRVEAGRIWEDGR